MEIIMTIIKNKLSVFQTFRIVLVVFALLSFGTRESGASATGVGPDEIRITYTGGDKERIDYRSGTLTVDTWKKLTGPKAAMRRVEIGDIIVRIAD